MRFRLVPKSSTSDDLERPKHTLLQKRCVFWSPLHKFKWRYPHYQRQKCRPMILVSGNIMCMRIFAGVPLCRGVKWESGCRRRQFLAISETKPTIH